MFACAHMNASTQMKTFMSHFSLFILLSRHQTKITRFAWQACLCTRKSHWHKNLQSVSSTVIVSFSEVGKHLKDTLIMTQEVRYMCGNGNFRNTFLRIPYKYLEWILHHHLIEENTCFVLFFYFGIFLVSQFIASPSGIPISKCD